MKKSITTFVAAGGLVFAAGAQAAVITDSFTNALQTTEISQNGTLDKFDSSLGTLNSVTLTLSGDSVSQTVLENTSAQGQFFEFDSTLNFFFDATSVGLAPDSPAFTTTLATTGGFVNLDSGASQDLGETADSGSFVATLTDPDAISAFLASADMATFDIGCNTISGSNFNGGGGNINNVQTTDASCNAQVSYDFAGEAPPPDDDGGVIGVPEPTALMLIGAGLLGFVGLRRRKSS
jgi:hypothetical protein